MCAFALCLGACCENEYTLRTRMNTCGSSSSSVMCVRCVAMRCDACHKWLHQQLRGNKSIRNCCSMQCRFDSFDHLLNVLPTGFDFHSERAIKCNNNNNRAGDPCRSEEPYTLQLNFVCNLFGPTIVLALSSVQ